MSYFQKFLTNLTDPDLIKDITQNNQIISGTQLFESNEYQARGLQLYNFIYEKEPPSDDLKIINLKKYLYANFSGLFFKKASLFKTNITIDKFKSLNSLLIETNQLDLLPKFLSFYSKDLILNNINDLCIHVLTTSNNDILTKNFLNNIINHYQLEKNPIFSNLIQLCELKNFLETKKFLTQFMGINLSDTPFVDLILNYAINQDFPDNAKEDLAKIIINKSPKASIDEWRIILKNPEKLNTFFLKNKDFFNFFLEECNINIFDLKNNQNHYLLTEALNNWDVFEFFPAKLTSIQAFCYAVYIKKNNPTLVRKSIISILKDYIAIAKKQNQNICLESIIPQFPILWWGCSKNYKTYTSAKFWSNLELIPEIVPHLIEPKASTLAQIIFNEKGTYYTKIISDFLDNGAKQGKVEWHRLAFLKLANKLLNNRDDFQTLYTKLEKNGLDLKTYTNLVSFFNHQFVPEIGTKKIKLFNQFSKDVKFNLLSAEVSLPLLNDCFEMINRLNSLKLDFTPPSSVATWQQYHDYLVVENNKVKVKGIKLNQEHLIDFFHNKNFIGMRVHVPLFSEDFVWAGESLGICVGTAGYDKKVANKESNIVFLIEGSKVKYVIEFTHERIIQAKGNSNSNMNKMDQTLLKAFMKEQWWNNPKRSFKNEKDSYYNDFDDPEYDE